MADIFPEGQILKMGKAAMKLLEMKDDEFYEGMGVYFVTLATDLGYGLMLQSVGRRFRDFFVNLDNLHDYLKFTFQRMKAPSFFLAEETPEGMLMEYRSKFLAPLDALIVSPVRNPSIQYTTFRFDCSNLFNMTLTDQTRPDQNESG